MIDEPERGPLLSDKPISAPSTPVCGERREQREPVVGFSTDQP